MARVLFIAPGPIDTWASSRLRCLWPARALKNYTFNTNSVNVVNIMDGNIPEADVYVWGKRYIPELLERDGVHIWDICDPVHWFDPEASRRMAERADAVVASNEGLAKDFSEWANMPCRVIPDRLDLSHYPRKRWHDDYKSPVRFIWYGAGQNRMALYAALASLERLRANGVEFSLTICDDHPNNPMNLTDAFPIHYVKWALHLENEILAAHDIALIPPYPGPWGEVKSNNKALTAAACGLAATDGLDYSDVYTLATDYLARRRNAGIGLHVVQDRYEIGRSGREWNELIYEYEAD